MKNLNSALRRYYRTIRSYLPCSHKLKNRILEEIQGNVNDYLEKHPDATIAQIETHFGTPENIAAAYVDDMDTRELLCALRIRKKFFSLVVACICIILIMWGITVVAAYVDAQNDLNSYTEEIITELSNLPHQRAFHMIPREERNTE